MRVEDYNTKTVFKMSIPIFIEMFLQLLVGNIDQMMISQYSESSVAAVGNANQIINIVIIFLNVMCIATTILVSQYIGSGNRKKISEVCTVSLSFIVFLSAIISAVLILFARPIFTMLNVPASILDETCMYIKIIGGFIVIQGLYLTIASALRSYKLMNDVMIASVVMNILNIAGNAVLINGLFGAPRLGIVGAAISTNISKAVGLIIVIFILIKKTDARVKLKYLNPFPKNTLKQMLYIGLPTAGEELSYSLSQMVILMFINLFGTSVIATKVYASMLANVAYVYTISISAATQIVIGYFIGADRIDKIEERVWSTMKISILVSLSITVLIYLNSDFIFNIFTDNIEVITLGKKIMFIELILEVGRAVNIVMTRCLLAIGDIYVPAATTFVFAWVVAVGLSYILGVKMQYGLVGIWAAMCLDEIIRAVIFSLRFKTGGWRKRINRVDTAKAIK